MLLDVGGLRHADFELGVGALAGQARSGRQRLHSIVRAALVRMQRFPQRQHVEGGADQRSIIGPLLFTQHLLDVANGLGGEIEDPLPRSLDTHLKLGRFDHLVERFERRRDRSAYGEAESAWPRPGS